MIDKLYTMFFPELVKYMTAACRDQGAAEDVVQEAFMRALENAELLGDMSEKQCRAWLYKTARNLWIDKVRHIAAAPPEPEAESAEDDLSAVMVRQLLLFLPENERRLFELRYFAGYNSTELSDLMGIPPATIRSRLASAKRKLRSAYYEIETK